MKKSLQLLGYTDEEIDLALGVKRILKRHREHNREVVKKWQGETSMSTGRYNPLTKQI